MSFSRPRQLTLVFIHGWGCRASDFDSVIAELKKKPYFNIGIAALDLPGHGDELKTTRTSSILEFSNYVLEACDKRGLEDVVFLGHSMGVRIALQTWALAKQRRKDLWQFTDSDGSKLFPEPNVKALIFVDGASFKLNSLKGEISSLDDETLAAVVRGSCSARTPTSFVESAIRHVLAMDKDFRGKLWDSMVDYDCNDADKILRELGKESDVPVLNLQSTHITENGAPESLKIGEKSRYMKYLEEFVPSVRHLVVPESGHYPHADRPDMLAEEIFKFLKELSEKHDPSQK